VWRRTLGEVENERTSHNFSFFAIFLPKIIKSWWKGDEVLTKTILHSFFRHGVDETRRASVDGYTSACCDLDLWTRKSNQYISRPRYICDLILVKLAPIVRVVSSKFPLDNFRKFVLIFPEIC